MQEDDIIDLLFYKQEDDDLFSLNDDTLKQLDSQIEIIDDKIKKFIDKRVHPKTKEQLKYLISQKEKMLYNYLHRKNQLFYKNGVSDGLQLFLTALSIK